MTTCWPPLVTSFMMRPDALYPRHMLDAIDRVIEATQRVTREDSERDAQATDSPPLAGTSVSGSSTAREDPVADPDGLG